MDIKVPSLNSSSAASSTAPSTPGNYGHKSTSDKNGGDKDRGEGGEEEEEKDQKGFLVHTSGCVIPDFDPFHHTVTRFISNPISVSSRFL